MTLLKPGDKAPEFNLPDQNGVLINLYSFIGKRILIYFYPKAITPGCTIQACRLRDNIDTFKKLGIIEIIGISGDKPEKLFQFYKKEMLNFILLYDENHQITKKFGAWGEKKFMGKIYNGTHRVSFIINKTGIIEKVFEKFKVTDHEKIILNYLKDSL